MSIASSFFGGPSQPGDHIQSRPLNFTSQAGITAVFVTMAGAVAAVLQVATAWKLTDTRLLGAFGLMSAGVLGFAIASAGDAIARAYSASWVVGQTQVTQGGTTTIVDAHPAILDVKFASVATPASGSPSAPVGVPVASGGVLVIAAPAPESAKGS
jgi:hypothetical protein